MKRFLTSLLFIMLLINLSAYVSTVSPAYSNTMEKAAFASSDKSFIFYAEGILLINEVFEGGEDSEGWIELYNNSDTPLNLKGYCLSNEEHNLKKWKFPDVTIGSRELLTVWSSGGSITNPFKRLTANVFGDGIRDIYERLNTDIKISVKTNPVILTAPDGLTIIDCLEPINIPQGHSCGRYPDGGSWKSFKDPTPDSSNNNADMTNIPGKPGIAITWDDDSIAEWHNLLSFDWFQDTRNTFCLTMPYRQTVEEWEMLRDLKLQGHEIACHGYNHESSVDYINKYGLEAYIKDEVIRPVEIMASMGLPPETFAYPNGVRNASTDYELLKHFKAIRKTSYSPQGDPFSWGSTKVIPANGLDVNYQYSLKDYFSWLEKAKEKNHVVVLYGHTPAPGIPGDYRTPHRRIEAIIDRARKLNLTFYTLSDLAADTGTLKITFPPGYPDKAQWTLDRKTWYKGGESMILPVGRYSVMFRHINSSSVIAVDIEKSKLKEIIMDQP